MKLKITLLLIFISLAFTHCRKWNLEEVAAVATVCDSGYEGNMCEPIRDKYFGYYNVTDVCPSGTYDYTVQIVSSSQSITKFLINGFGGFDNPVINVVVTVLDSDNFEIASQSHIGISNVESTTIGIRNEATGIVTISYEVGLDGGPTEVCEMIMTPQ